MKLGIYGYKLSTKDLTQISKMLEIIGYKEQCVYDLISWNIQKDHDIILTFGEHARRTALQVDIQYIFTFPDLLTLSLESGNTKEREEAYKKLLEIKDILAQDQLLKVTQADIPALTIDQIRQYEQLVKNTGQVIWKGISANGKSVVVSTDNSQTTGDINLTFAELIALNAFFNVFTTKEVEISKKKLEENL